jgi:starch synthase
VGYALPRALAGLGHDVRVVMPLYRVVDREAFGFRPAGVEVAVASAAGERRGRVWAASLPGSRVTVYALEQPELFDREGLYQEGGEDYPDNLLRFGWFAQAALQVPARVGWTPEVVHAHDWQAALACVHQAAGASGTARPRSLLTIHNLAYQGVFPAAQWAATGLPPAAFVPEGLEHYGQINCLKGGLASADALTTVSPTYAREIQTTAFGCGLERLLRRRRGELVGILNGIDVETWNPRTDPMLASAYDADHPAGKALCKLALQQAMGLPPRHDLLLGMVQRLAEQKGIDLFLAALEDLLALPVQIVLLGSGDPGYASRLREASARQPDRLRVALTFDEALAHRIEAGADAFLMPSRFEPCGLNQMYSMRYGAVPIVRRVGGLADTVTDLTQATDRHGTATGFVFEPYTAAGLLGAVRRALAAFRDHGRWARLVRAGMSQDFSWARSARAYVQAYERLAAAPARVRG